MRSRPTMTGWYNPTQLLRIAVRVAISTVFGEFADKRQTFAATSPIQPGELDPAYDYSGESEDDFWFDFMADTGDGWDSTYAMARLVCEPRLNLGPDAMGLTRGRILILGGDEVYPTASRAEYHAKLRDPFRLAAKQVQMNPEESGDLYAIPGNHDWYDGLEAFIGVFCRRRSDSPWSTKRPGATIGGRATQQTRSYFAIRLPGNWWLWGADIQLTDYIDQPQVDFFAHVASEWMEDGSKLIICTGKPSWEYCRDDYYDSSFPSFSYLEHLAATSTQKKLTVKLILSGDSHHYARYTEDDRQYITCGGGGAFLHPTHHLPKSMRFPFFVDGGSHSRSFQMASSGGEGKKDSVYPTRATSRRLAFRNLLFALFNGWFTLTLFGAYAILNWLLSVSAQTRGLRSFEDAISQPISFLAAIETYAWIFVAGPLPTICLLASCGAYAYLADMPNTPGRRTVGVIHAVVQGVAIVLATCGTVRTLGPYLGTLSVPVATLVSAVVTATLFGVYLLLMLNVFGRHWNEAFSSLRIRHYKSFLRFKISKEGTLTVFPVGLQHVPAEPRSAKKPARNEPLEPHLIELPIRL